jgi:hypothetical protein
MDAYYLPLIKATEWKDIKNPKNIDFVFEMKMKISNKLCDRMDGTQF